MSGMDAGSGVGLSVGELAGRFGVRAGYLGACMVGVAPRETITVMAADLGEWGEGHREPGRYGAAVERARGAYAGLVGVPVGEVAVGSQVSVQASLIAGSLAEGSEVLVVDGDFSSMVYPFLVREQRGRIAVRCVPLERVAESIRPSTDLVSFSLVQSATGEVADVPAIVAAAEACGAATFCDTTQAVGWMRVDASEFDATVCHAYKWLCSPRGTSFLTVKPEFAAGIDPVQAGWYAGDDVWGSCYGPGMRLAAGARRFDVSPAWQAWLGTATSVELFATAEGAAVEAHCLALAEELCGRLGVPWSGSAIVTWPDEDGAQLAALSAAGVAASARAGRVRVAFHVWNTRDDVAMVVDALSA